jgi:hypothetical protein
MPIRLRIQFARFRRRLRPCLEALRPAVPPVLIFLFVLSSAMVLLRGNGEATPAAPRALAPPEPPRPVARRPAEPRETVERLPRYPELKPMAAAPAEGWLR